MSRHEVYTGGENHTNVSNLLDFVREAKTLIPEMVEASGLASRSMDFSELVDEALLYISTQNVSGEVKKQAVNQILDICGEQKAK